MKHRIMHIDMDAFYASIEQADHPEWKGKPVIVGASMRGVVCAASYEARKFGVRSAMPVFQARRLCPGGVYLPVRMKRYREVSSLVMEIFRQASPLVEQVSIDEAYLDVTGTEKLHGPPERLAAHIKEAVLEKTSLTCSIGIAPNRFLAKIASEMKKPDGLTIIEEEEVPGLLQGLPVTQIPGIGSKTGERLHALGIRVVGDILKFPLSFWTARFGKSGAALYEKAQGQGSCEIVSYSDPKSSSAEDTFDVDTDDPEELKKWLLLQAEEVGRDLRARGLRGKTVTLKVKFADFKTLTRSRTLSAPTHCTEKIFLTASRLLGHLPLTQKVRLIGVGVSHLVSGSRQMPLFPDRSFDRLEKLDVALDEIHKKFGDKILKRGRIADFDP
ncbi:DNA polymerase IV [Desulforhabdus sp. TSK]|uniref:DNA polymerase IV n=1 Tax=Desulforhabdus sp. TSK TaxID=2925014 RepID=UPI001FC7EB73|nr:DNA polymerase IV [Desulforhabdus sp. TSK]GKT08564.1 DNA polymerase IV [Desulforhabdus sp. TSK]